MKKFQKDFVNEMQNRLKTATVEEKDAYSAPIIHFHNTCDVVNPKMDSHTLSPVEKIGKTIIVVFDGYRMEVPEDCMDEFINRWAFLEYNTLYIQRNIEDRDTLIKLGLAGKYMNYVRYFI